MDSAELRERTAPRESNQELLTILEFVGIRVNEDQLRRLWDLRHFLAGLSPAPGVLGEAVPDSRRLDWLLMDMQPDGIGGMDIWERVDSDCAEEEVMSRYLAACRRVIDAAMGEQADSRRREE
jgi:hypothetical protein